MAVCSKLFRARYESCRDYLHPWTNSCSTACAGVFLSALTSSFRLYLTVYLLALLMKGRKPTKKEIRNTILGILQSTAFIGAHASLFSLCVCSLRTIMGHYNFFTFAFLPTFISSWFAILVERPSRRSLLSLYVTNIASETLYYMMVWRGMVKPVPFMDVFIFAISMSWLLYRYKGSPYKSPDSINPLIRFIVGPYEQLSFEVPLPDLKSINAGCRESIPLLPQNVPHLSQLSSSLCNLTIGAREWFKKVATCRHCNHPNGCLYYSLQGGLRVSGIGYGLQVCLITLMRFKKIVKNPSIFCKTVKSANTFRLGAFLGGFSFVYRMLSCSFRRIFKKDSQIIAIPAAFGASISFGFYRSNTIALYVMWKSLQILYLVGFENHVLPEVPCANIFFHCFSTAILFHAAVFEPQNLRSSYWGFLHNMSGGRMGAINRNILDTYNMGSNEMAQMVIDKHGSRAVVDSFRKINTV